MGCSLPILTANTTITNPMQYELSQEETNLLKIYTCQSNEIKFKSPKSSIPSKRFNFLLLTTLNPRKTEVR